MEGQAAVKLRSESPNAPAVEAVSLVKSGSAGGVIELRRCWMGANCGNAMHARLSGTAPKSASGCTGRSTRPHAKKCELHKGEVVGITVMAGIQGPLCKAAGELRERDAVSPLHYPLRD